MIINCGSLLVDSINEIKNGSYIKCTELVLGAYKARIRKGILLIWLKFACNQEDLFVIIEKKKLRNIK